MDISNKQKRLFQVAKSVSEQSDFKRIHIGCVATEGHQIISTGCNSNKTHPLQKEYNKYRFTDDSKHSIHAELKCLLPLIENKTDFSKVSLYTYREHVRGGRALAAPCPSCRALIRALGIKKIYYTGEDSYCSEVFD